MLGKLDGKWIALGVLIMVVLNIAAAYIIGLALAPALKNATSLEDLSLSNGQVLLALVINTVSFLIGGFIVGVKSVGRTILEPGISAVAAVLIVLLVSREFSVVHLLVSGVVPFAAAVIGGWLGERRQAAGAQGPQ